MPHPRPAALSPCVGSFSPQANAGSLPTFAQSTASAAGLLVCLPLHLYPQARVHLLGHPALSGRAAQEKISLSFCALRSPVQAVCISVWLAACIVPHACCASDMSCLNAELAVAIR